MNLITAYIALGSNLGSRERNLRDAIDQLRQVPGVEVLRVSSFLENPAVGGPEASPPFLNAAAELQTMLPPADLLKILLTVEQNLGRIRREKWEPRVIDLDLLLYGNQVLHSESLTLPHPLMHARRFVLEPLAEIAPDTIHPVINRTIATLLTDLAARLERTP